MEVPHVRHLAVTVTNKLKLSKRYATAANKAVGGPDTSCGKPEAFKTPFANVARAHLQ